MAVGGLVLQCVAVCCSVYLDVLRAVRLLFHDAHTLMNSHGFSCSVLQCVAVGGLVLQCVTVCCSVLQCVLDESRAARLLFHAAHTQINSHGFNFHSANLENPFYLDDSQTLRLLLTRLERGLTNK